MNSKKKAFTLAEIIVTLMLVVFVAVILIPFLLNEFHKDRWTITFKRSFAETFNALSSIALDEDCARSLTCTNLFNGGQKVSTKKFGEAFANTMVLAENCETNPYKDCFSHKVTVGLGGQTSETLRETMEDKVAFDTEFYTFKTVRGVSYAVFSFGMNCLNEYHPYNLDYLESYVYNYNEESKNDPNNQMLSLCGFIVLDVNAERPPNIWGRDVFGMWVTDRSVLGVYPFGGEYDNAFRLKCNTNSNKDSQDTRGCAAELIQNGWEMKY